MLATADISIVGVAGAWSDVLVRVEHHTYFALESAALSAADITRRLGVEPDAVFVRGSMSRERDMPPTHSWRIVERTGETIDDQLEHLIDRLKPVRDELVRFMTAPEVRAVVRVVRHFGDGPKGASMGWRLSPAVLGFLADVGAGLDVDEYDMH